ncbi:hypothetical protein [Flavobacterium sp. 7A]|uniref:hypothetical protein n=1 Tax=Flavobacterium sp. 7A TaxID=2940571 RepID=UPI00222674AA|nr:hypothetical protein [Flavobacterium sp. 7A]MCW2120611.1 hypothetical protein [Flavobacterium sp. 7A]
MAANNEIDGNAKIRYIEMYGSVCCPRDYKYNSPLLSYIKNFEAENDVKLDLRYKISLGKEGEAAYFLSLENLTPNLRQKFVVERLKILKKNDESIRYYLENPISIKKALNMWGNMSISKLIKI